jgi:hypothetical protein
MTTPRSGWRRFPGQKRKPGLFTLPILCRDGGDAVRCNARLRKRSPALIAAFNGLRVSEATGSDIEALGLEHRHPTLTIVRKVGKITIPLASRAAVD